MKSVVCVKRVPDTEARIRIDSDEQSIETSGIKFVMNPYDEFAVEAALKHKEAAGSGDVTVISVGSGESAETLRTALAMGADQALLLTTEATPEGLAVARILADELREREFDLLLFGMKAVDDDLQAVGPMVAELLGMPAVTVVTEFSVDDGRVSAHREIEGGVEIVELPTPCVITLTKGAYEPRYASLKGIMAGEAEATRREAGGGSRAGS